MQKKKKKDRKVPNFYFNYIFFSLPECFKLSSPCSKLLKQKIREL